MIIVAFDTATPDTVVGVVGAGDPIALRHEPGPDERPGHARVLIEMVDRALMRAGAGWEQVGRIGVGVGPGTFTGLRIGVATARALAQASGAELAAVSTLRVLAAGVDGDAPVLACLDARRGEAFTAVWERDVERAAPAAVSPDALGVLAHSASLAVGDGATRYRAELEAAGITVAPDDDPRHHVDGAVLAELAARAAVVDRDALVPDYVRAPDAKMRV